MDVLTRLLVELRINLAHYTMPKNDIKRVSGCAERIQEKGTNRTRNARSMLSSTKLTKTSEKYFFKMTEIAIICTRVQAAIVLLSTLYVCS